RIAVEAGLLLVGGARRDALDVLAVARVLGRDDGVLVPEVVDLLREPVADEGLLRVAVQRPNGGDAEDEGEDRLPHAKLAGTRRAGRGQRCCVSHAGSLSATFPKLTERMPTIAKGLRFVGYFAVVSQRRMSSASSTSRNSRPSCRIDDSSFAKRSRNLWPATRSASSGLTLSLRASATMANSRSPTSSNASSAPLASASSRASSTTASAAVIGDAKSNPTRAARFWRPSVHASAGSVLGTRSTTDWSLPARRASSTFACSQLRSTSSAFATATSPKTCGWRATIFAAAASDTSAAVKRPSSAAISACIATCSSTSPSSSLIFASSRVSIASSSSYVSSSRYGRSESCVCSRSHGHPSGARRRATTSKSESMPGRYGLLSSAMPQRFCHGGARAVAQALHLVQKGEQVAFPALALPPHLELVHADRDAAGHTLRQRIDVEQARRVDAQDDVVALRDDAAQAHAPTAQLHAQREHQVVELGRARTVAVDERPRDRVELRLVLGRRELPVGREPQLLVADVRARD